MNKRINPAASLLAALLSGMADGKVEVTEIDLDPNMPIDEQINAIGEKAAAAHRKECSACRDAYEAEQKENLDNTKAEQPHRDLDALQEKVKAQHQAERDAQYEQHENQRAALTKQHQDELKKLAAEVMRETAERARFTGMKPEMEASYGKAEPMPHLARVGALRQLRHNYEGVGFVFAYDKDIADKAVAALLKQIDALNAQIRALVQKG